MQLSRVKKYNRTSLNPIKSYYITLEAEDPVICGSLQTFQTKVSARTYSIFDLKCTVARLLGKYFIITSSRQSYHVSINLYLCIGETKKTITGGDDIKIDHPNLPELPQESPFVDDGTNRFSLVN